MNLAQIGNGETIVVAEIGICHNGDLSTALDLIEVAARSGCDAVKFQVGNPRLYVNRTAWDNPRETPWGTIPYITYRERLELSDDDFEQIDQYCTRRRIGWFVSPLDDYTVDRMEQFDLPAYKVASPMLTNTNLLARLKRSGRPVILSTGMSDMDQIDRAVEWLNPAVIMHCTSSYPCPPDQANLRCIETLRQRFPAIPIGYSGHETGVIESVVAVALGAYVVERHITLSRAQAAKGWSTDHAVALEPHGLETLVRYIRTTERALGDGVKKVYEPELLNAAKFRHCEAAA